MFRYSKSSELINKKQPRSAILQNVCKLIPDYTGQVAVLGHPSTLWEAAYSPETSVNLSDRIPVLSITLSDVGYRSITSPPPPNRRGIYKFSPGFELLGGFLLFCPEDWGSRFLRNVGKLVAANDYKA
jgi:hypothetical protein